MVIATYNTSLGLTKIAILLQYQRVFPARKFQFWCWSFIAFVTALYTGIVIAALFACTPIEKFWTRAPGGHCIDTVASWL